MALASRSRSRAALVAAAAALLVAGSDGGGEASPAPGRPATPAEAGYRTVAPDGRGLPPGGGTAEEGAAVYAEHCERCHGPGGEGGPADRLVGGRGTLASAEPVRTATSYWPYATTIFDYVRRAMPLERPGSLADDEVYAVTAYLLHRADLFPEDRVLDAGSLPEVELPNRNGFVRAHGD